MNFLLAFENYLVQLLSSWWCFEDLRNQGRNLWLLQLAVWDSPVSSLFQWNSALPPQLLWAGLALGLLCDPRGNAAQVGQKPEKFYTRLATQKRQSTRYWQYSYSITTNTTWSNLHRFVYQIGWIPWEKP